LLDPFCVYVGPSLGNVGAGHPNRRAGKDRRGAAPAPASPIGTVFEYRISGAVRGALRQPQDSPKTAPLKAFKNV
jgi:hypothetical protein